VVPNSVFGVSPAPVVELRTAAGCLPLGFFFFFCAERLACYVLLVSCFGLADDLHYRGKYDARHGADTFSSMTEESALCFGY
jgi:hypothetical protein